MSEKKETKKRKSLPFIELRTSDMVLPAKECKIAVKGQACILIIAGATGDLTARKLLPSLFNLYQSKGLPESFAVVGCGRTTLDTDQFKQKMEQAVQGEIRDRLKWEQFAKKIYYQKIFYDDPAGFNRLNALLKEIDSAHKTKGNRIFYLALPPNLYPTLAKMLGNAGLGRENSHGSGWSRLVVEKPFGRDLKTAIDLDRSIHRHFREHQVFRIDHYLAKETVQNILMFRFANTIFEPIWNRRYIKSVKITATETLGIEHRAGYYEQSGVLRDMFQNHMMQLLALTAMEPPSLFEADRVRDERVKVFRSLRPFPVSHINDFLILGQYDDGNVNGDKVPAYRRETNVDADSITPTYACMKAFIDNWRWQGVPFLLISGKRLAEKVTRIAIQFREVPHSMFRQVLGGSIHANHLTIGIYPEEKISLTFQTKTPGPQPCLRNVTMDFFYHQKEKRFVSDAYEKVLLDCMLGDQMLFWRQDAVEQCWSYLTPILEECDHCRESLPLHMYPSGSWGPQAAQLMIKET
jgi:glucose-6-phosphate 1-dehydrogenase